MDKNTDIQSDASSGSRPTRPFSDWVIPVIIFIFCASAGWLATTFKEAPDIIVGDAMQPRNFPLFLLIIIAILNCVLVRQMLKTEAALRDSQPIQTFISGLLMIVFYVGAVKIDMFLSMAVVMFCMCLVWGERRIWVAALVAVGTCATIFFTFDQLLKIRFPRGILTNLWYG